MVLAVRNEYAILLPCFCFFSHLETKIWQSECELLNSENKPDKKTEGGREHNTGTTHLICEIFQSGKQWERLQAMAEQITCLLVQANWSNTSWLAAETDIFTYLCVTCTEVAFIHGISLTCTATDQKKTDKYARATQAQQVSCQHHSTLKKSVVAQTDARVKLDHQASAQHQESEKVWWQNKKRGREMLLRRLVTMVTPPYPSLLSRSGSLLDR